MKFVTFVNGSVLLFMSALMLLDAAIFPVTGWTFLLAGLTCGTMGSAVALAGGSHRSQLHRLHGFLMTATVWITAALAGAVPLYMWGLSPVDAVFEAMSGITTTGSTVMAGLDDTSKGILFWRSVLQAVGGIGFIVTGIALLPILRVGGMQLFRTESSEQNEKEFASATRFAIATLFVYLGLMLLCGVAYALGGMSLFEAVNHAMTTLATGGYSTSDSSFGHFESPFLQWSGTLFMLLGGLPLVWYIRFYTRRSLRNEQVRLMITSLVAVILSMSLWLSISADLNFLVAVRLVAFNVVSVVTTTGYATTDYSTWGTIAVAAFFILTAVGGCSGSTAGGTKAMRWVILGRAIKAELARMRHPNSVNTIRYDGQKVEPDVLNGVISFVAIFFATFLLGAAVLNLLGLDFTTAVSGSLTALANVGPGLGEIIGPAGNFSMLSDPAKLTLVVGMYLGRLEILTVLIVLAPNYWRAL
ncbi:TrkH family potassium uptake protein [Paracoccus saliphilus]|uniref:Trk system potassium uptake protein n=1 Tax=Paracoccus saliphilus TaxID=405559 RepID=A0AA45W2U2_9RHOB|nr:TrkH family potassium uptake protein [Paracoccus saliphilus]WCR05063.1 TrkH family potassium uptake protein [Paracoccus saliphilus]SIS70607.1 trk system potassium uptake protein TrkH [Paracoccus saliphilus]